MQGGALFVVCAALQFAIGNSLLGILSLLIAAMSVLASASATDVLHKAESDENHRRRESLRRYRPRRRLVVATAVASVVGWVLVGWLIAGPSGAVALPLVSLAGIEIFSLVVRRRRSS